MLHTPREAEPEYWRVGESMKAGTSYILRHPVITAKDVRGSWAVRKAMNEYDEEVDHCEFTERTNLKCQVHHILPVSLYPQFAACKWNFIKLAQTRTMPVHRLVGHGGNWKNFVPNVKYVCKIWGAIARTSVEAHELEEIGLYVAGTMGEAV